jgi:23S rRNA (uracil1939-C5)-methyltransferase
MPEVKCTYADTCGGCDAWSLSYETQIANKRADLYNKLQLSASEQDLVEFVSLQKYGLRHRFDFTFENKDSLKMGLYGKNRELIDLNECLQLTPALQKVFSEFRKFEIKSSDSVIQKGSVRLRRGPTGLKGCWLDLANTDIKKLLDDSSYLTQLLEAGFYVEMGQKGKSVQKVNGVLKLTEPQAQQWFETIDSEKKPLVIKSLISDFTQPSWLTAEKICEILLNWIPKTAQKAIEFGPGIGQFTLPLLSQNLELHCFENNPKALDVLKINAQNHKLAAKLKIHFGDFQTRTTNIEASNFDFALVNPPRSGLKKFVEAVIQTKAPNIFYVSCFPESMETDISAFKKSGYQIRSIKIVDQFPQTPHYESCVWLQSGICF